MYRVIIALFVIQVTPFSWTLAASQSDPVSVSISVQQAAESSGSIELQSNLEFGSLERLSAPLPPAFLPTDIKGIDLMELATGRSLAADRLWLRGGDSLLYSINDIPFTRSVDLVALEYHPSSRDLPGTYQGKLIARGERNNHSLEIMVEIEPFVAYELHRNRLGRDHDGNPTGQIEIHITSNARQWSLSYRLETPAGGKPCADLSLGADRKAGAWDVATDGLRGVISGRGPVQERLLVLIPQGGARAGACDAVVVIEEVTAR